MISASLLDRNCIFEVTMYVTPNMRDCWVGSHNSISEYKISGNGVIRILNDKETCTVESSDGKMIRLPWPAITMLSEG